MDIRNVFSVKLQEAMKTSHLSYAQVAKRLGITKATMSMYKNGKALPSLETFSLLCDILDVSADFLLDKKEF